MAGDLEEVTAVEQEPTAPTVALAPQLPVKSQSSSDPGPTTVTPALAMQADELARTKLFLKISATLATLVASAVPFLSGAGWLRVVVFGACLVTAAITALLARAIRPEHMEGVSWLLVNFVLMASSAVGAVLIGVFSPAPMVGTLGIYFLCLGSSSRVAVAAYLMGSLLHLIPAVAIATGVMQDPGLFKPAQVTRHDLFIAELLVQSIYGLTFVLARGSRRATLGAVDRLHQALAQVQKREALLAEAHQDLDRALRGGLAGRYTERRLGPYTLGAVIGRGAMSEVYRAQHQGGEAAVKVLARDLVADPVAVRRFLREAEIVSALRSPHVVRVLSFGNFGGDAEDPPYLAMELLDGHDLAWHLRRERRMEPARVIELIDHVADALSEAAAQEVVHRDLKPQNLFRAGDTWKVLDFGVSKLSTSEGTLTRGKVVGTPGYMAPEQARGEDVTPRADVFSLAVIAYRALTGRPAFAGKDMPRVLFEVCYVQPVRPGRLTALPEDVERVLALGLAKKAGERIESARVFAAALRAASVGHLDPTLRKRADRLLMDLPWGARPPG